LVKAPKEPPYNIKPTYMSNTFRTCILQQNPSSDIPKGCSYGAVVHKRIFFYKQGAPPEQLLLNDSP